MFPVGEIDIAKIITDITLVKSQQKELERLSDGIQKLINPIILNLHKIISVKCNKIKLILV